MSRVAIVGGGIAGLSAAYRLAQNALPGLEIVLLEASERLGGKILTDRTENCVFELGPDSFMTIKPYALELIRELGLESKLVATDLRQSEVFVFARGRMRRLPDGIMLMAPSKIAPFLASDLFTWRGKLRMALDWFLPAEAADDESMADFARRRFGQEALDVLVQPVMAGIYAGDADRLSLKSTFPRFVELERRFGSVIRGLRRSSPVLAPRDPKMTIFMSLAGGLADLTEALGRRLGASIRTGAAVRRIARQDKGFRLEFATDKPVDCDGLIIAVPAWQAAEMLTELDAPLADELGAIPFASSATISLAYSSKDLNPRPHGFGFVVARGEVRWISATTYTSTKFPGRTPEDLFLVRCFLGGVGRESLLEENDARIQEGVLEDFRRLTGIAASPKIVRLRRWIRSNPQYTIGHEARLERIEARLRLLKGLRLAGASYRGPGIPDCINSGARAAGEVAAYLSSLG